jgi:alkaline phosphatase
MSARFYLLTISISLITSGFSSLSAQENTNTNPENPKPKNIVLLIGDGMGLSEVSAALFYNKTTTNFERFSTIGLIKTSSSNELITDSAAGATAFSAGIKTYNGAIGVDRNGVVVETILEQLVKKGYATGLVATSSIVHATPASFYAHAKSRKLYEDIATFLPSSNIDFLAGGGTKFFNSRKDGKDLFSEFKKNGYIVHTKELPKSVSKKKQVILLGEDAMPKMLDGRGDFLPNATKLALDALSKNETGFFLMIEGSQIDWGGHDNDADYLISELLDFDKTIGAVLDFSQKNGETLVIVTADHETGGFTLSADNGDYNKIKPKFSTSGHSATMVPVFAFGPGAENFGGVYENTEIYHKVKSLLME